MTVSADQLRDLMALGLEGERLLTVVEIMSRPITLSVTRSRAAINQANYRAKLKTKQESAKANDVAAPITDAITLSDNAITPRCGLTSLLTESPSGIQEVRKKKTTEVVEGRKRGSRITEDWQPREEDRQFVSGLGLDPVALRDEFVDFWIAVPGSRGLKLNWDKTYKNRAREVAGRRRNGGVNGHENIRDRQRRETAEALEQLGQFAKSGADDARRGGEPRAEHARLLPVTKLA